MHSSGRLSRESSDSGRRTFTNLGTQIMGSTKIPVASSNDHFGMALDENEDFFLGSPKKREQHQYDCATNDSTPEKDYDQIIPVMTKINSDFRDVFQPIENNSYEMVEKISIGQKISKTSKKSKKPRDENDDFGSLFSNSMILKNQAPAEDFKSTEKFRIMRDLQSTFDGLEFKENDPEDSEDSSQTLKFDFESEKGYNMGKSLLKLVEKLFTSFNLKINDRSYRAKFTRAYKMLYEQNGGQDQLSYLTEILDSAQENYPHLWVNGEKYVFSEDVIKAGDNLSRNLLSLRDLVTELIDKTLVYQKHNVTSMQNQIRQSLVEFDLAWSTYEQYYVYELMVIETDARRFIIESIKIEQQLRELETTQGTTMAQYNSKRQELVTYLSQINAICNVTGKGRDDLTDLSILFAAEKIQKEIRTPGQAQAIQVLADKICQTISCFRILLNKYSENLDSVDPQLKNNAELTELIELYESSWTSGKDHLVDPSNREQIISFCEHMETLGSQYPDFKEQVECSEAEIFLSIPCLMVFQSIKNDKNSHNFRQLCSRFCENIDFHSLQKNFDQISGDRQSICSQLEQFIINDDKKWLKSGEIQAFGQKVKNIGMELSRSNAQEFNGFITAALNSE